MTAPLKLASSLSTASTATAASGSSTFGGGGDFVIDRGLQSGDMLKYALIGGAIFLLARRFF